MVVGPVPVMLTRHLHVSVLTMRGRPKLMLVALGRRDATCRLIEVIGINLLLSTGWNQEGGENANNDRENEKSERLHN